MEKNLKILTYGCQMNVAESERMAGQLKKIGYTLTENFSDADLILINTCCVRETAEEKIYGKIGELKKYKFSNPNLILGIVGCMAQKNGENLLKNYPHVDFVLGTGQRGELLNVVKNFESARKKFVDVSNVSGIIDDENIFPIRGGKISAFVPIMYGCNNFCTYCIVPYVRGRERSRQPEEIFSEIKNKALFLPTSESSKNAFVVKYSARSQTEITRRLFIASTGSIEHIVPYSEGGANSIGNFLLTCASGNRYRENMSLVNYTKRFTKIPLYCQKYIDDIIEVIHSGGLKGNETYPYKIKEKLAETSQGRIMISLSKYKYTKDEAAQASYDFEHRYDNYKKKY